MSKGIEEIKEIEERLGYKNSELLRFHITEKIEELNETVERNGNNNFGELSGDIFASLIDLLIVLLFGQTNEGLSCRNICVLIICILIFVPLQKGHVFIKKKMLDHKERAYKKLNNVGSEEIQKVIRQFDNVAFDYLLLCHDYINKYEKEKDDNIREFYIHEVVYYCKNSIDRFSPIYTRPDLYVTREKNYTCKIEKYRVNNFISIIKDIASFIDSNKKIYKVDEEFYIYMESMVDEIKSYKKFS